MTDTAYTGANVSVTAGKTAAIASREINAVKVWAGVGVLWLCLILYTWGMWISTGEATPTIPQGLTEADAWRVTLFRILEIGMGLGSLAVLYFVVIRPWRREGHLTTNGLLVLIMPFLWFQDPLVNIFIPSGLFSSIFYNFGSWTSQFPLTTTPNAHLLPEAFPFQFTVYLVMVAMPVIVIAKCMRLWVERFPDATIWSLLMVGMSGGMAYDLILEIPAVQLEVWAYPSSIRALSIWAGTPHQFPLYEVLLFGFTAFLWSSVMFFKNDKGQLVCERGIEKVQAGPRAKTGLRYLALLGIFQTIFFIAYMIPWSMIAMHADEWPDNMPAHMVNGMCGQGTDVICPGPGVPYLRGKEGLYITPDEKIAGSRPAP